MAKTIVLTGATGLIGGELFKRLTKRGDKVRVLVRNPETAKEKLKGADAYAKWDAATGAGGEWEKLIGGADAVINLAGAPVAARWTAEYKQLISDSRVAGTRSLVQAMEKAAEKPRTLINGSAIGYYGTQPHLPDVMELSESASPAIDFLAKVCVDWEAEAIKAEKLGVRVARVRTGVVLSTKDGALQRLITPFNLFVGGPIGDGEQWFSWIHIDDEVNLILYLLDTESASGAFNASAPQPVTMKNFARALGAALSRPSFFSVPKQALALLFGEGAEAVAEGQRVVPKRTLEAGFKFAYPALPAALKDILAHEK
ncbi:MAG: TIGR01777 family protein [Rhizobacter sp.]|nr:TIGR01777 family protein [Chlorobiales bacterium]